jgi:hypothetical protein
MSCFYPETRNPTMELALGEFHERLAKLLSRRRELTRRLNAYPPAAYPLRWDERGLRVTLPFRDYPCGGKTEQLMRVLGRSLADHIVSWGERTQRRVYYRGPTFHAHGNTEIEGRVSVALGER